ncbi:pyruvate kinase [Candidatus Peregrinibacteria bacterium]|nr:pyruvate kinase [Candidatus Peregrinibacteria bacterium]
MFNKKTKIVCTLGPATLATNTLVKLIQNGMNVARLNFSHGDYAEQLELINNIHQAEKITGQTVAIMQDLQGPKIRLGELPEQGVTIKTGEKFILDTGTKIFHQQGKVIPVQYQDLHKDVSKDDIILIEDGLIKTRVVSVKKTQITVRSLTPGILKTHKGLNVPTASISADPLTKKDLADLKFGLKHQVDLIALSFVRHAKDIERLRKLIRNYGSEAKIIAKIERHEALKNLEKIIQATDGVMVARGDLGVETPAEEVPIAQKMMVRLSGKMGKPVIIATEMLQSMIEKPRATRAEISDAANAVFDHTDALMLSNETAVGKYPVEAVRTLATVAEKIEKFQKTNKFTRLRLYDFQEPDPNEICHMATKLADETEAALIVTVTGKGFTAREVAKQRSFTPILVITPDQIVKRQLQLVWGINKIIISKVQKPEEIASLLKKNKLVKKGQKIVIVSNASSQERQIFLKQI